MMTGAGVTSPRSPPATTFGFTPCTVGCAHVTSSPFEVWRRDGWRDRARGLCARERTGRALQSPTRSLLGPSAQQLIPGCFPFPAGGAFPPLWNALASLHLSVSFSLHLFLWCMLIQTHSYRAALALLHSSPHPHVRPCLMLCTVDSISPVPQSSASSHF